MKKNITLLAADIISSSKLHHPWRTWRRKRQPKPRHECSYCCELKREGTFVELEDVPYDCQTHIHRVCRTCMDAALAAQLDVKPLIEVGCPQCGVAWDTHDLFFLMETKTRKRFVVLEKLAREQVLVPAEMPDGATMEVLLEKGARFCPFCRWAFVKEGGCNSMLCTRCGKYFDIQYALVLEDERGRRAATVLTDRMRLEDEPM